MFIHFPVRVCRWLDPIPGTIGLMHGTHLPSIRSTQSKPKTSLLGGKSTNCSATVTPLTLSGSINSMLRSCVHQPANQSISNMRNSILFWEWAAEHITINNKAYLKKVASNLNDGILTYRWFQLQYALMQTRHFFQHVLLLDKHVDESSLVYTCNPQSEPYTFLGICCCTWPQLHTFWAALCHCLFHTSSAIQILDYNWRHVSIAFIWL